jgi:hypothetical protein
MADPGRLGKRGAYRLGEPRLRGRLSGARAPREPSFGARRSRPVLTWLTVFAVTAALLGLGAGFGLWWLPFAAGIAAGACPWRTRSVLPLLVIAVLVGWGAALWWPALSGAPAGATARVIAALAGLPPHAVIGVAGTLLVGLAQALVGLWLARALTHRLRTPPRPR